MCNIYKFIIGLLLVVSCHSNNHMAQLEKLDNQLSDQAEFALDSLKKINMSKLNKSEKAYYYLLLASATDKNFIHLTEDTTLQIAAQYYKGRKDYYNLARTQYYMAKYASYQGKKEDAYDLFKQTEVNLNQSNQKDAHLAGLTYFQLAKIQNSQNNLSEAENYSKVSLNNFIEAKDTISAAHSLKLLGQIYINDKTYDKAQNHLLQALDLVNSYSNQQERKTLEIKAGTLNILSVLSKNMSNLSTALRYGKDCINVFSQTKVAVLSEYYYSILSIFIKSNQPDSIKYYCNKMITTAKEEKKYINLMNGYKLLARIEENQENYERACLLKDTFNIYKDKYNLENKSAAFIDLEKRYDITQKEKQLLKAEYSKLRSYTLVIVIVSLVFIAGIILYSRHRRLVIRYNELSEIIQHTEWGFSITKELIAENNQAYDELEKIFNRLRVDNNSELYNKKLQEAFARQKSNYSAKLFSTLTDFDKIFIRKFQNKFPTLNSDDVMMAAMIRHKWKLSDIAAVFHATPEAIRKRKSRLTSKISNKLKRDIVLEEYLKKI